MSLRIHKINLLSVLFHLFTITMISSITIFTTYAWGRYVLMGCIAMIMLCDIIRCKFKYQFRICVYFVIVGVFIAYTVISSLWAINPSGTVAQGKTLLEIFLMVFVLYNHYSMDDDGVKNALFDIKLSSFVIVIYSLIFYGVEQLMLLAEAEERLASDFANVNTIGILAAFGIIIQIDEMISKKKFTFLSLLCIPSIFLIAVTQSRKALVMVGVGLALVLWQRKIYSKSFFKTLFKLVIYVIVGVTVARLILSLPVFDGIMQRMETLTNSFIGEGKVDSSAMMRKKMVEVGINTFLENPFFGIGIGNSGELTKYYIGMETYLHNNFVELLATGGIVGFSIYYSMYFYLISRFLRYRKCKNAQYIICLTLMLVLLFMDYGRVSYYAKTQYIFLMIMFLETEALRKKEKQTT